MDIVSAPLRLVDTAFAEHVASGGNPSEFVTGAWLQELAQQSLPQVPSLNSTPRANLTPGSLIRFRCMIQGTFDPEFYLDVYETRSSDASEPQLRTSRYRDTEDLPDDQSVHFDSPHRVLKARHAFYCVPIPGENEWARQAHAENEPQVSLDELVGQSAGPAATNKRALDDDDDEEDDSMGCDDDVPNEVNDSPEVDRSKRARPAGAGNAAAAAAASTSSGSRLPASHLDLNMAHAEGTPTLVKVYEEDPQILIHQMVEFIGVYVLDPTPPQLEQTTEDDMHGIHPPSSLVPRLHAIAYRKLEHSNPMIPPTISPEFLSEACAPVPAARAALARLFTGLLGGDALAAEYIILGLVSSIYKRDVSSDLLVGKLSVNLSQIKGDWQSLFHSLSAVISSLTVKSHDIRLQLEYLNTTRFSPWKNETLGRLEAGVLQLTTGTHLLVDETAMEPGQLLERGVKNVSALQELISAQNISIDFEYYGPLHFPCDVPALVLSEGKSIFSVDVHVPFKPEGAPKMEELDDAVLAVLRRLLTCVRFVHHTMPDDVHEVVQRDFVRMRQEDPTVTGDTFHRWLTLARLHTISHGSTVLTAEHYFAAKELDIRCQERVAALPSPRRPVVTAPGMGAPGVVPRAPAAESPAAPR